VLVDGASMPRSSDLPEDLKPLVSRQSLTVSHERFSDGSQQLIRAVERALEGAGVEPQRQQKGMVQGEEAVTVRYTFKVDAYVPASGKRVSSVSGEFSTTWNEIFSVWAPVLMPEAPESTLKLHMDDLARRKNVQQIRSGSLDPYDFQIEDHDFQQIKLQLRSLGLIEISRRPRDPYAEAQWTLTPDGERYATSFAISSARKSNT
jgi:hypothetical protein